MKKNIIFENYHKSLEQKYNAVCFDIDGTLTTKGSKSLDDRAIDMIIELLSRKIPVVFIRNSIHIIFFITWCHHFSI